METNQPNNTALRTALWRALHVMTDEQPYIIDDPIGYQLIKPENGWEERPDMKYTKKLRASIVARARLIEDMAKEQIATGVHQYILLGAGLDSFAQRNAELNSQVDIYEIDEPDTLNWKESKLIDNGYYISDHLHFIPVNFETSSWWDALMSKGFDINRPAFVSCTGVTLYLTKAAIAETLKKMTLLAAGSTLAITFYLPLAHIAEEDQPLMEMSMKGAAASGTPFVSFFTTDEVIQLAEETGLKDIKIVSTDELTEKYFKDRTDYLVPASGEFFLTASI